MNKLAYLSGGVIVGFGLGLLWMSPELGQCRVQTAMNQKVIENLSWEKQRVQYRLAETRRELGAQLARKVGTIDDVMAIKVDPEVASIASLAARVSPIEKAIKQEATDNHEFIPSALRGYWGKVLEKGLTRGK